MPVAVVTGRLMGAAIPKGCSALFCLFPSDAAPSLVGTKAKSGGNRAAFRFTCSFRRLTGTPYRAARSESRMALCPVPAQNRDRPFHPFQRDEAGRAHFSVAFLAS